MGPPSYMGSVVDRNFVMRRITVYDFQSASNLFWFTNTNTDQEGANCGHYSRQRRSD